MKDYTQSGSPGIEAYQYAAEEMERMWREQRDLSNKLASVLREARVVIVRFILVGEMGGVADAVLTQMDAVLDEYKGEVK